jgi:hypothetical protein
MLGSMTVFIVVPVAIFCCMFAFRLFTASEGLEHPVFIIVILIFTTIFFIRRRHIVGYYGWLNWAFELTLLFRGLRCVSQFCHSQVS